MFILSPERKGDSNMDKLARLGDRFFVTPWRDFEDLMEITFPIVDKKHEVIDIENGKRILIDIPGRTKDNINIELKDDYLTVSGNKLEKEEGRFFKRSSSSQFSYSWNINGFDQESIDASTKDGVLSIDLKYKEEPKNSIRKINIS